MKCLFGRPTGNVGTPHRARLNSVGLPRSTLDQLVDLPIGLKRVLFRLRPHGGGDTIYGVDNAIQSVILGLPRAR